MSLGSRIVNRGKAAAVVSLTSTPREPLLFLYPQWVKNASTIAAKSALVCDGGSSISVAGSYIGADARFPVLNDNRKAEKLRDTHPIEHERVLSSGQVAEIQKHGELVVMGKLTHETRTPEYQELEAEISNPWHKIHLTEQEIFKKRKQRNLLAPKHAEEAFKRRMSKKLDIWEKAENNAHSKRRARKEYQEARREEKESWIPDWRVILGDLRKRTPWHPKWFDNAVSISVPANTNGMLLRGVDDNIWDIARKYDCTVTLGKPDEKTAQCNELILSGSLMAISKTAAEAMRISPGSKIKNGPPSTMAVDLIPSTTHPTVDSNEDVNPVLRYVRAELSGKIGARRAEDVPKPTEWTVDSFADYVDRLTSMQMSNHKHHLLYKSREEHVKATTKILRGAFTDPKCKSSLSRTAFKMALNYFVKRSSIAEARATFVLMEMMGIQMDAETFNILLRGAAKAEDLHNFHFILHLMLRRGIAPNGWTWVTFLMANSDSRIKNYIVAEMEAKGLMAHPAILRRVCQEVITHEVNTSLDLGHSQHEFLKHMDSRYGKNWITGDTGNRVLHALGARSIISRCWDFLQVMSARFAKIDHVSINTILNHCKQQANAVGAIEIMRNLPKLIAYEPDSHTYHILFEIAWRKRSFNLARVVWKYACLSAATTAKMRMLVAQSLINATQNSDPELSQPKRWRQQAGYVISNDVFQHPLSWGGPDTFIDEKGVDNGGKRDLRPGLRKAASSKEMIQAVTRQLERDCKISEKWKAARPFADELMRAWELDRAWQRERMQTNGGDQLDWKVQEAMAVHVLSLHETGYGEISLDWR